ncbi:MAG: cell division protein ZipA C-terminal FtsZ-binding domain-containing protein [Methylococcaceae bacterium]|jgi:cell division protein ZipA
MDKEVLRIVIIATGLLVILAMLLWSFIKNRNQRQQEREDYEDKPHGTTHQSPLFQGEDDFDIVPLNGVHNDSSEQAFQAFNPTADFADDIGQEPEEDIDMAPRFSAPAIIQFSLIANSDQGFNGADLDNAFNIAGLKYGNLKIYERLDSSRLVDFGVACLVEPGTFPEQDLENFYTPGLVFFMQPEALDDAQSVFDDYINTLYFMAKELDGEILDHERKPLTAQTVQLIRHSL